MWLRAALYWGYQYKRTWRSSIVTSFLIPVLYLTSMGVALGSLVDKHSHGVAGVSYVSYLAPGLLAATCMQIGANDTMWPVMGAIKWMRTYLAMLAAPLDVYDVLLGHLAWVAARLGIVTTIYLAVMAAFGTVHSPWAILALPAGVLTGMAFAAPMAAFSATQEKDTAFSTVYRFVVIPLFLFSGTFFPISQLPRLLAVPGLRDAALPRRGPVSRPHAGDVQPVGGCRACRLSGSVGGRGLRALPAHLRRPAGRMSTTGAETPLREHSGVALRITPLALLGGRHAVRVLERNILVYRRSWIFIVSGFFEPLFYLLSIGVGLSHLVGPIPVEGRTVPYTAFVAPGLLAASAMNGAMLDSTFLVFMKLKIAKTYDAMLATPLAVGDIALGELSWCVLRGALYSGAFLCIMTLLGYDQSPWVILCWPGAILITLAFAAVGMAGTTFMRSWQDFDIVSLAFIPLFLFSATFYPITVFPGWLQAVVRCTPLYQGVVIERAADLGIFAWSLLLHLLYLAAMAVGGVMVTRRRLGRLLLP